MGDKAYVFDIKKDEYSNLYVGNCRACGSEFKFIEEEQPVIEGYNYCPHCGVQIHIRVQNMCTSERKG